MMKRRRLKEIKEEPWKFQVVVLLPLLFLAIFFGWAFTLDVLFFGVSAPLWFFVALGVLSVLGLVVYFRC